MSEPRTSASDPTPEERKGDSSFLPVVVAAGFALIVILLAAVIFLKTRQNKAIPAEHDSHPTSRLFYPQTQIPTKLPIAVAA